MTTLAFLGTWWVPVLVVLFLGISVVLILTVLIQRPQGGGLVGAFGSGAGSGQTAFGAKTGDALTLATIAIFLLYLAVAVGLNWVVTPSEPVEATPVAGAPADVSDEGEPPVGDSGGAQTAGGGGSGEEPETGGDPTDTSGTESSDGGNGDGAGEG